MKEIRNKIAIVMMVCVLVVSLTGCTNGRLKIDFNGTANLKISTVKSIEEIEGIVKADLQKIYDDSLTLQIDDSRKYVLESEACNDIRSYDEDGVTALVNILVNGEMENSVIDIMGLVILEDITGVPIGTYGSEWNNSEEFMNYWKSLEGIETESETNE